MEYTILETRIVRMQLAGFIWFTGLLFSIQLQSFVPNGYVLYYWLAHIVMTPIYFYLMYNLKFDKEVQ